MPGSITPHTKFECEVYVLSKDEGGRHTPFFNNYRPQFYFRTTDVTGAVELPEGSEMVMPGDNIRMVVDLISPIAMEEGLRFAIREGGPYRRRRRSQQDYRIADPGKQRLNSDTCHAGVSLFPDKQAFRTCPIDVQGQGMQPLIATTLTKINIGQ